MKKNTQFLLDEAAHVVDSRVTERWNMIKKSLSDGKPIPIVGWDKNTHTKYLTEEFQRTLLK